MLSDNWQSLSPLHSNATALESQTTINVMAFYWPIETQRLPESDSRGTGSHLTARMCDKHVTSAGTNAALLAV